jgi:hypothetical protein
MAAHCQRAWSPAVPKEITSSLCLLLHLEVHSDGIEEFFQLMFWTLSVVQYLQRFANLFISVRRVAEQNKKYCCILLTYHRFLTFFTCYSVLKIEAVRYSETLMNHDLC